MKTISEVLSDTVSDRTFTAEFEQRWEAVQFINREFGFSPNALPATVIDLIARLTIRIQNLEES